MVKSSEGRRRVKSSQLSEEHLAVPCCSGGGLTGRISLPDPIQLAEGLRALKGLSSFHLDMVHVPSRGLQAAGDTSASPGRVRG